MRLDLGVSLSLRFFRLFLPLTLALLFLLLALVLLSLVLFLLLALVLLSLLLALSVFFLFVFSLERPRTMNRLQVSSKGTESGTRRRKAFENESKIK